MPTERNAASLAGFLFDLDDTLASAPIDFAGMKRSIVSLATSFGADAESLAPLDILGAIEFACRSVPSESIATLFKQEAEAILVRYEMEAASSARELPDASKTLNELRARSYKVGIVTRNCRAGAELTLRLAPMPYDILLTRNDVLQPKPDPRHLMQAARSMGADPARCAMVGDHPMDIQAGRAAGMLCIAVQSRDASPDAFAAVSPDVILPGVKDLLPWMSASSSSIGTRETY
jgi:phosphoglycolate phosphatase